MPKSKKPKWEYLVVYMQDSSLAQDQKDVDIYLDADKFTQQLNKHGEAGWELVSFEWRERGAKAAFKRQALASHVPIDSRLPADL